MLPLWQQVNHFFGIANPAFLDACKDGMACRLWQHASAAPFIAERS
jgi:hypothetical protein